jgi:cell division protein FtsI (penicillin-binding protein 3)
MNDEPPSPSAVAHRFGAPPSGAVPRMENVRLTAPDLQRRALMAKTRSRLVLAAGGFSLLFAALVLKLADATIIQPTVPKMEAQLRRPDPPPPADGVKPAAATEHDFGLHATRASITDRNGEILAISLPTAALYANPREMIDPADTARRLKAALPDLDEATVRARLNENKQFVYLARQLTPRQELQINDLGIPGVYFEPTERRHYPLGRVASQVLGGVDVDGHGVAGVERFFDQRLHDDPTPLALSIDVRVQAVMRDELLKAMDEFEAIGACGIVMDVRTGEVLAMVSLPDYDANDVGHASPDERFNRAVTGMYEPGSTFKLQTASLALDSGTVQIWNGFDASAPIHIGRFTITDFEGKHRWLYLPEILAYSSNIGAARMAEAVGSEKQRAWMQQMGMLSRIGIELPEAGLPLAPPAANWKEIATLTIGFGHGIAVSPLHVVDGTAAVANGGVLYRPTILAHDPNAPPREGFRVMKEATSDIMRKLMRLVVTDGYGKPAEVPGYYVGGKTGTAEKVAHRGYEKHANVAAFTSVFPMNAPRFAVYMMLDEPKANASTHGYATAGWVIAPSVGKVIARIGPMEGLLPDLVDAPTINASLYIPLQPGHPPGVKTGPLPPHPAEPPVASAPHPEAPPHDYKHEASLVVPAVAAR